MIVRRLLPILCPGLLLVSCDKSGSSGSAKDSGNPKVSVARGGHAPRQRNTSKTEALRADLETAVKIESPDVREKALADVAWNAIETDPDLAREALQHLPEGSPERMRLIQHYAMRMAEQDPEAALAWATALGTEQEIAAAKGKIALVLAESDPSRAANLISESGIVGREFDVAVVEVVQRWTAQSPSDAAAWVILFPPGQAREAGIKYIAEQWLKRDAASAFDWLETVKDESLRKETLRAMEGFILQQPQNIREEWLQHANSAIQSELELQREQAIKDVGDNLPTPQK